MIAKFIWYVEFEFHLIVEFLVWLVPSFLDHIKTLLDRWEPKDKHALKMKDSLIDAARPCASI